MGKLDTRHVVVDIETTGLNPKHGARIIEIGAVAIEQGRVTDEYDSLINCGIRIPKEVQQIHRISDEMLLGKPGPEKVYPSFLRFIANSTLLAHNAKFDIPFIKYELSRLGLGLNNSFICTLQLSKKHFPNLPNHKLATVAQHLLGELPPGLNLHRALDDARLTAKLWMVMKQR